MKTDGEIKEAMDVLYKISGDKEAIILAEMREKAIMDEQSRLNGARKEGREEGREETIKRLILKQYSKGLSIEYIAEINEIDIEYVSEIVKNNT